MTKGSRYIDYQQWLHKVNTTYPGADIQKGENSIEVWFKTSQGQMNNLVAMWIHSECYGTIWFFN